MNFDYVIQIRKKRPDMEVKKLIRLRQGYGATGSCMSRDGEQIRLIRAIRAEIGGADALRRA